MSDKQPAFHPHPVDDYTFHRPRPYVDEHQDQAHTPAAIGRNVDELAPRRINVDDAAAIAERTAQLLQAGAFEIPADVAAFLAREHPGGWMGQTPIGWGATRLWLHYRITSRGTLELALRQDDNRHIWAGTLAPPRQPTPAASSSAAPGAPDYRHPR